MRSTDDECALVIRAANDVAEHQRVCAALAASPGIERASAVGDNYVIAYDVRTIGCAEVIAALLEAGGRFDAGTLERLRIKLRCYRDAIRRDEQMNELGWDSFVREIYVSRYRHRRHGRRDDRPRNWRHYSKRTPA